MSWRPYGRLEPTLRDITLHVRRGERVLLAGPSGSGKSTLLRALAGLLDDSLGEQTGSVRADGTDPAQRPGTVGLLLQDPTLGVVAEYAGRDAAFGPENRGRPRAEILTDAAGALDAVRFAYGADRRTDALSGGETQRLALAGALALHPSFLLLDEPTAMLDPESAAVVRRAVEEVVERAGLGLVVVEHRMDGWSQTCDRLIVLAADGSLVADGPTTVVLAEQTAALLAAGVWVPQAPVPEPTTIDLPPLRSAMRAAVRPAGVPEPLQLRDLAVRAPGAAGSPTPQVVLEPTSLGLAVGEGLALTGPSGAGKTTVLRTIAGLHPAAAGTVRINGRPGWVPQHAEQMITRSTVIEELLATAQAVFTRRPDELAVARARAESIMDALDLRRLARANPYQLSGGEQRRVALAAAVVHDPAVLLLDEPTVGQDRLTWAAVQSVIAAQRRAGGVVVAGSHDPDLVRSLGAELRLGPARPTAGPAELDHVPRAVLEPGSPWVGSCNPLAAVLAGVGAAVGSFFVRDWTVGLIMLVVIAGLAPLAVRRLRSLLRLAPVGLAALSVGWSALLFSSHGPFGPGTGALAAREVLRICCLVVPGALVLGCLRPSALGDALAQRLRLSHRVVVAVTSSLLRLDQLGSDWRQLAEVRAIRGLATGRSPVARVRRLTGMTVAMLVGMLRSAQATAVAMDARGFAAARRRTFALDSPWRGRDWGCCLVGLLLALSPALLGLVS